MRRIDSSRAIVTALVLIGGGCSSAPPNEPVNVTLAPAQAPPIYYFQGHVDTAKQTMELVYRSPSGGLLSQTELPYGNVPGAVYFHTCGTPVFNSLTHVLTGSVQAVNLTGANVGSLKAVIDSVSPAGVVPSSGTIATYGTVAPNTGDCASTQPWAFLLPTNGNFSFEGHADGVTSAFDHITNGDFQAGTGTPNCSAVPPVAARTGWTGSVLPLQIQGCASSGAASNVMLAFGTLAGITQTFAATSTVGTLNYKTSATANTGSCSFSITFNPSLTIVPVTRANSTTITSATPVSVPVGTTSVSFGGAVCGTSTWVAIDDVSLVAF